MICVPERVLGRGSAQVRARGSLAVGRQIHSKLFTITERSGRWGKKSYGAPAEESNPARAGEGTKEAFLEEDFPQLSIDR